MSWTHPLHVAPDLNDIERNKLVEPEGERLRAELIEWINKNGIVSVRLDTDSHLIHFELGRSLPPRIKPVLTLWGSIFVKDEVALDRPDSADAQRSGVGDNAVESLPTAEMPVHPRRKQ